MYGFYSSPKYHNSIVCSNFPLLKIKELFVDYVDSFKYFGHFITNELSDVADIQREMRTICLFVQ